jgi:squalene synthase HpnC
MPQTPLHVSPPSSGQGITPVHPGAVEPALRVPDADAVMRKSRRENFAVASHVLPRARREDLYALYGFARLVDDIGDETPGDRLALLDWLEREVDALYAGEPEHELMRRLEPTVRAHAIPREPFARLIEANRRDQQVVRCHTFEELLDYCRLSANPVGELVLYVFDSATPDRVALSDRVCSALQIVEHLQDVGQDFERGRVYLPLEDLEAFGSSSADLAMRPTPEGVRRTVALEAQRARALLDEGAPLARRLRWRAGLAVAGFVGGGRAALAEIERQDYDVLQGAPRASRSRRAAAIMSTLIGLARS